MTKWKENYESERESESESGVSFVLIIIQGATSSGAAKVIGQLIAMRIAHEFATRRAYLFLAKMEFAKHR